LLTIQYGAHVANVDNANHARPQIALFLDESGTSATDPTTLVGVVAFHHVAEAEAAIRAAYDRALGDASLWPDPTRRQRFAETGFHFAEDSESVRQVLLATLGSLQYRAYIAYASNTSSAQSTNRLTSMYGTLLRSVLARYRNFATTVVFEQNSAMDGQYARIWAVLQRGRPGAQNATAFRGTKGAPCLCAIDYVLGVVRVHLSRSARPFETNRFAALGRNLAYLIDFDDDRHLGGRKHPIV
jgi:hypothetical protein